MQYHLVGGLWLGSVKPDMNKILKPILTRIKKLEDSEKIIRTKVGNKKLKAKLILATFDLIAKAMAMNLTQFNGKYGCPYCLDIGTYEQHRTIYLLSDLHEPRIFSDVILWATMAQEMEEPVYGVFGPSVLSDLIDIILCIPVDYMHAILEGLAKQFMKYWFGSEFSTYVFNIRKFLKEIDKRLLRMKPPHAFRRSPRSINSLSFWKASELRAWLLYYSIPAMKDYLPQPYINHWCLLVCAMHILLNASISSNDLHLASEYLKAFYEKAPELYPSIVCTANLHSVIHISQFVKDWGPLWCYSTFGYENLNGFLLRQCHGTGNVLPQVCRSLIIRQKLNQTASDVQNYRLQEYLHKYDHTFSQPNSSKVIKVLYTNFDADEKRALQCINIVHVPTASVTTVNRLKFGLQMLHIRNKETKRNSSVCEVRYTENAASFELLFISVRRICMINNVWYAIGDVFDKTNEKILDCDDGVLCAHQHIEKYMHKVKKVSLTKKTIAVSINNIISVCVHIALKYSPTDYIFLQPNEYEHH